MYTNGQWHDIIDTFMEYTENVISPKIHRLWAAISMIGGACERRVWTQIGENINFANLYVLLVAPPGTGKAVIDIVKDLWQTTEEPGYANQTAFRVASDSVTRASLVDEIDKAKNIRILAGMNTGPYIYHTLLLAAEEFEVFMPGYDSGLISTLNKLWNNNPLYTETRRTGPVKSLSIQNPQLCLLGGAQPSYFVAHFPEEAWTTGLVRRTLMIYADAPPVRSLLAKTANKDYLKKRLLHELSSVSSMYGEAKMSSLAAGYIDDWHQRGGPPAPDHPRLQFYKTTRSQFLIKLALISGVSRTGELTIDEIDADRAKGWLIDAERVMPDIYRAMTGKSDALLLEELHMHMTSMYAANPNKAIEERFIYNFLKTWTVAERADKLISFAEKSGMIKRVPQTTNLWIPLVKDMRAEF